MKPANKNTKNIRLKFEDGFSKKEIFGPRISEKDLEQGSLFSKTYSPTVP
jgi:hypothetical protein